MAKLEVIDGKQTNWAGLWWHPEYAGFSSDALSLSELRKFKGNVRLYMRKNRFYNNGENGRPNYKFCLKDANSKTFYPLEVEADEETAEWKWHETWEGLTIYDHWTCSKCGGEPPWANDIHDYKFCPYCGARMDEGVQQ